MQYISLQSLQTLLNYLKSRATSQILKPFSPPFGSKDDISPLKNDNLLDVDNHVIISTQERDIFRNAITSNRSKFFFPVSML